VTSVILGTLIGVAVAAAEGQLMAVIVGVLIGAGLAGAIGVAALRGRT
jgi:hypothetical protein